MERRLIDANAMRSDWLENGENEYVYDANAMLASIDEQPTIDAVEVVRCRDCEHWGYGFGFETDYAKMCGFAHFFVGANGYCVYGERRKPDGE